MIAVLVREKNPVELFRRHLALFQSEHDLARAQPAIDQNLAVIRRHECTVPRATAAEDRETEHAGYLADASTLHKWKSVWSVMTRGQGRKKWENISGESRFQHS